MSADILRILYDIIRTLSKDIINCVTVASIHWFTPRYESSLKGFMSPSLITAQDAFVHFGDAKFLYGTAQ